MYSALSRQTVSWHFNNEVFDQYPWDQEPESSLDELYDRRARQIREEYDYVMLSYSGGSDTHNILESFLRQNLFIDEVVTNWSLDASEKYLVFDHNEKSSWNINAEFKLNAVEKLNYIKNKSPNTKITVNDTSRALIDSFLSADDASWVQKKREVLNPNGTNNFNFTYFKSIRETFDRGRKIALIVGLDKPKIKINDNQLYLLFIDKIANIISVQDHIEDYPNAEPVLFYWSPHSCDILAKQAHTMLKYINANPKYKSLFETPPTYEARNMQEHVTKHVVYTTWNTEWFQTHKARSDWHCELDDWFIHGWQGTREHAVWLQGLDYVASKLPKHYLEHRADGSVQGIKAFISPLRYIGPVTC